MAFDSSTLFSSIPGSLSGLVGAGSQAFLQSLSQHARLFTLETPLPAAALLVEEFSGNEAVNGLFRFQIACLATSAHFDLADLLDQPVTLRILLANGSTRSIHGYVTRAMMLGSDGAVTRYSLTVEPWVYRLVQQRDCFVFQDMTVLEIAEQLFKDHATADYRIDVKTVLPKRSYTVQYREDRFAFLARLFAEEGLSYYFEQSDEHASPQASPSRYVSNAPESKTGHAKHTLVIFDDNATLAVNAEGSIRFHRAASTEASDTITHFSQKHQVASNAVSLTSWDHKKLVATSAEDSVITKPGDVPTLEIYEGAGAYRYTDENESTRIARARAESLALSQQMINGESAVRALATGTTFTLTNYGDDLLTVAESAANGNTDPHRYAVLSIEHKGKNNLSAGMATIVKHHGEMESGTYRNRFTCVPCSVPIRPTYFIPKPTAPGLMTAIVTGIDGQEITTDRDHRIKVQFVWQRGDRAASGQGMHPEASNAPGNETSSAWVRVMERAAGSNWGSNFTPRVGQEVQIEFVNGDIDRPISTGQVYSAVDQPAWHGGDNHAGALSGFKSKEEGGSGFNQLVMDDTPNQLRQSFGTTTAGSQFNAGYLIKQDGNVRSVYRGSGLELATDAWGILRAKQGMFITTTPRNNATSTQLDTTEAQGKLKGAADLSKSLSDAATQHQAAPLSTPDGLQQLTKTISGKQEADGQSAPVFTAPVTLIDSEAGISITTPASAVTFAGQDTTFTSHGGMRLTGGETVSIVAGKTASLFTHSGGAKVIAGNGPVSFQAHTGGMEIIADQSMTVTSSNGDIKILAKQIVLSESGGAFIDLDGANITIGAPSVVSVKGASHDFMGAASVSASLPELPAGSVALPAASPLMEQQPQQYSERLAAWNPITGESVATAHKLIHEGAVVDKGRTTGDGFTARRKEDDAENLSAVVGSSGSWGVQYHSDEEVPPLAHGDDDTHTEVDA